MGDDVRTGRNACGRQVPAGLRQRRGKRRCRFRIDSAAFPERFLQNGVILQQLERNPARRRPRTGHDSFDHRRQTSQRTLYCGFISNLHRCCGCFTGADRVDGRRQRPQPFAAPRRGGGDGDSQCAAQRMTIDSKPLLFGFINQIDAEHSPAARFQRLQTENQAALQTGRICDDDGGIRAAEADGVPCDFLFGGSRQQRISAGQIGHPDGMTGFPADKPSAGIFNGFPRPVAGVLVHPGQRVEDRAFADVRVSGKADRKSAGRRRRRLCISFHVFETATRPGRREWRVHPRSAAQ